ncbi:MULTISPECIES: hypothetical protein [unclassified Wolbachia]|nr:MULTISPECIES: hypothetical protein [unclassified Wolbachia]QTP62658.1 hypothetical protein HUB95_00625 [Wolbachia endosymbiont of Ceratosolen solmsi]
MTRASFAFFRLVNFLMFVANMNKHLRVTSASRVSSQCPDTGIQEFY